MLVEVVISVDTYHFLTFSDLMCHHKACIHYFSLFLKEQCVSWLFQTK